MTARWPQGLRGAGVSAGIKAGGAPDLGLLVADSPLAWVGTFTKNAAAAAPVAWCRARLGHPVQALVVNSGNANACTGPGGHDAVEAVARAAASAVGCDVGEVLVASTGPIGVPLPAGLIVESIPRAMTALEEDVGSFARSILTTDTHTKVSMQGAGDANVVGVAKGAAMLAPNMATMLAFLVTDGAFEAEVLQDVLDGAVARSFDRISVDACESTNDSVFLFSTGRAGAASESDLAVALESVCSDLAEKMVRDAEGGTKLVRIRVRGAADEGAAVDLGRAVAASALWRSAVYGGDPNWGRIVAALGAADRSLDLSALELSIGAETVFVHGAPGGSLDEAAKQMTGDSFDVTCVVGTGPGAAEVLSADLSPDYVKLNAYGTT